MAEEEEKEKGSENEIRLSAFVETDKTEREEVLSIAKYGLGAQGLLSCTILTTIIAWRDPDEIFEIFRRFRECLEERIEPGRHSLVVLDRIFAVVEAGERALRAAREPSPWIVLKGKFIWPETDPTKVFTREESLKIWSLLDRLCDQIIFMEELVRLVMTETVESDTFHGYLVRLERCLMSVDREVRYRINNFALVGGGDGRDCWVTCNAMKNRTREMWRNFQIYHQPFATRSDLFR